MQHLIFPFKTLITFGIVFAVFLTIGSTPAAAQEIKYCPEGQFYSIKDKVCLPLMMPSYGFQEFRTGKKSYTVEIPCSGSAFRTAASDKIDTSKGDYKIVKFPNSNCTINMDNLEPFLVSSNTVVQGAGQNLTKFEGQSFSMTVPGKSESVRLYGMFVFGSEQKNIVISNLTLDGKGKALKPFHFGGGDNVLLEKTTQLNFVESGMHCKREDSQNLTMRYSTIDSSSNNLTEHHGIACEDSNSKISFYSNLVLKTKGYGIDTHSDKVEIAGNYVDKYDYQNNKALGQGIKIPDTENLIFHHNLIKGASSLTGARTYCELKQPDNHVYFNNNLDTINANKTGKECANKGNDTVQTGAYFANNKVSENISGDMIRSACPNTPDDKYANAKNPLEFKMDDESKTRDLCVIYKEYLTWITNGGYSKPTVTPTPLPTTPTPTPVVSTPTPTPTPLKPKVLGDADLDGDVDLFDYNILVTEIVNTNSTKRADFDNSGEVNLIDYSIFTAAYLDFNT